ncbi:hypothetical protein D3C72_1483200 [compost metagenome]
MPVVPGQVFQHGEHTLDRAITDQLHITAFLQQLAAHVEWQVCRIDHALHKPQVLGHQRLCIVHDEDALDVQLDAGVLVTLVQVERRLGGDVQQLCVLGVAFDAVVAPGQRIFKIMADGLVEVLVLLVADVLLGTGPQSAGLVDGLPLAGLDHFTGLVVLAILPLFLLHQDRQADVVRVLGNDLLELVAIEKLLSLGPQMQGDAGAALFAGDLLHLEITRAAAHPAHAVGRGHPGAARFH